MNNETGRNHSSSLSRLAADGACPNGLTSAPEKMLKNTFRLDSSVFWLQTGTE
jgi:hypothetical protein